MALQEDTLGQSIFMNSGDMIPKDHICHLVAAIVDEIDVSEIEEKFVGSPGNPAYPRRMLLRLLVQAAIDGMFSSRKIAKLARENVIYIHLTGNKKPDFRTICIFRNENRKLMEDVFQKTVAIAHTLKILKLGHLSTDGTKIKANAANKRSLSKEDIEWIREIIERGIQIDKEEDELYGDRMGDELPPELDTKEKIKKKIHEIEKARRKKLKEAGKDLVEKHVTGDEKRKEKVEGILNKAEEEILKSGQESVSLTDPEARFMKNKKNRKELSYNPQITVDLASSIIIANDVCQEVCDYDQLKSQVEKTEANVGKLPKGTMFSFDNGYFTGFNLHYLEEKGLDGYIPDKKQAGEDKGREIVGVPYTKDKFYYDEECDCFICPQGEVLSKRNILVYEDRTLHYYRSASCDKCPVQQECAKGGNKAISTRGYEGERRRMTAKMETEEARVIYKMRKKSEPVFGDIKQNLGLREFVMRGVKGVRTEFSLACTAHNLKLIWNRIERSPDGITRPVAAQATEIFFRSRRLFGIILLSSC